MCTPSHESPATLFVGWGRGGTTFRRVYFPFSPRFGCFFWLLLLFGRSLASPPAPSLLFVAFLFALPGGGASHPFAPAAVTPKYFRPERWAGGVRAKARPISDDRPFREWWWGCIGGGTAFAVRRILRTVLRAS